MLLQGKMANSTKVWVFATAMLIGCLSYQWNEQNVVDGADILNNPHPPSSQSLCSQLIQPSGYACSEHTVQTKDGHLCALQRVSSQNGHLMLKRGPPVLLQHGLFMAGDSWFLNSKEQSLGFYLADHNFDVWVANARGTRWSHGHTSLSRTSKKFWDWSWQEMAFYDLSEMLEYVHLLTNSKILYIGHSQGTIMALAAFTQPNIAEMVEAAALLCPIAYLGHISSEFVLRMVSMHMDQMIAAMGIHELNFKSEIGVWLLDYICDTRVDCSHLLASVTGDNCCFNRSRVNFYLEYEPHPTSTKNLNHLFQMIRKGTFSMYDYGLWKNLKVYGRLSPPAFDIGLIPKWMRLWLGYGGSDALADLDDLNRTMSELHCKPDLLYLENYGHVDFLLSTSAKQDVYDGLLRFLKSPLEHSFTT